MCVANAQAEARAVGAWLSSAEVRAAHGARCDAYRSAYRAHLSYSEVGGAASALLAEVHLSHPALRALEPPALSGGDTQEEAGVAFVGNGHAAL